MVIKHWNSELEKIHCQRKKLKNLNNISVASIPISPCERKNERKLPQKQSSRSLSGDAFLFGFLIYTQSSYRFPVEWTDLLVSFF